LTFSTEAAGGFSGALHRQTIDSNSGTFAFSNGTGELLRITSDGKVGLGTSSPGNTLHVNSGNIGLGKYSDQAAATRFIGITGTSGFENVFAAGVGITTTVANESQDVFLQSHNYGVGYNKLVLKADGKVGIGTTSPSSKLHVQNALSGGQLLVASSSTNSAGKFGTFGTVHYTNAEEPALGLAVESNSTDNNVYIGGALGEFNAATNVRFYTAANTTTTAGSERARIDSSGRLLVGTSSSFSTAYAGATQNLQIQSTGANYASVSVIGNRNNTTGAYLALVSSRSQTAGGKTAVQSGDEISRITFEGADGTNYLRAADIACLVDGTPGSNDMPGRLVFSTTADGASSPTERMRISQDGRPLFFSAVDAMRIATAASAGTSAAFIYGTYNGTSNTAPGTTSFIVYTNGNVVNTNNSYGAISDIKLKENIVDASSQWNDLKALQVRNYNFKEGQTHTQIGLVAQEVELVSPGLVSESPDRDADGNDLGTVTKSVNYSVLYMKAVKALQEAMERIETLETKVAALEGN
jgi:hypothetical protein